MMCDPINLTVAITKTLINLEIFIPIYITLVHVTIADTFIVVWNSFALNVAQRRNFSECDATTKSRHRREHTTRTHVYRPSVSPFGVSRAEHSRRSICMLIRECLSGSGPLNNVMFIQRWYRCGRRGARHTRNRCHRLLAQKKLTHNYIPFFTLTQHRQAVSVQKSPRR